MFITIRFINKIKPKTLLSVKHKNQYTENEKKQTRILANYVKKQLRKDKPLHPDLQQHQREKCFQKKMFPKKSLTHFRPMFHLWINQVVGFYYLFSK